jgi:alkenylglycerophosphocholine/alkenylglycerophosphoethanolamine hydrolase
VYVIGYLMLIVALLFAVGDWLAVARDRRRLEVVCKPAALLALLASASLLTREPHDAWQVRFFLPGLGFSLAGDIFLMLHGKRFFLAGLVAFLLAHICYIIGFNRAMPPWPSFVFLIPVSGIGIFLFRRMANGLRQRGEGRMLAPVAIYSVVLSGMLFSAWATLFRPEWTGLRQGLAIGGASLFFVSDTILGWDRFVAPFPLARLGIHITYHLGQMALTASIVQTG